MKRTTWRLTLLICAAVVATGPLMAFDRPPVPERSTDSRLCTWTWLTGSGIGLWAEACDLDTGAWRVQWQQDEDAFVLKRDGETVTTVLQIFRKPDEAPPSAILGDLRRRGYIPDTDDCVFAPAAIRAAPRTVTFLEIRPQGQRLKEFEATPKDEIPDPPCGAYGWSTHGRRYFMTDIRQPSLVLYFDEGQDGTMIDPASVTFLDK